MSNGRKGKLVLQEVPSGEVEKKVVGLLLRFAKSASVEALTQKVRRTPYTLSNDIEAEKAALIVEAFEKFGATAAFVPHVSEQPAAQPFRAFEPEPRFVMRGPAVFNPPASGGPARPQPAKTSSRNLVIFLIFILMVLSFGYLAGQLWPLVGDKFRELGSYLQHLF